MPAKYVKILRSIVENIDTQTPVFPISTFSADFLKLLLELKYVEIQTIPRCSCVPTAAIKRIKAEDAVVFTERLFIELSQG